MAEKVLDADYIKGLLAGNKKQLPKKDAKPPVIQFATEHKPDPLKRTQTGYPQPGDKGDIWAEWKRRGRKGADEIIAMWG